MLKDYGMLAGNSRRKSPFLRDTDDHAIRLKRVPLTQAQNHKAGYNVVLSEIASPGESLCAFNKIRQREKLSHVLESNRQQKEKLLEHKFRLSPVTQIRH